MMMRLMNTLTSCGTFLRDARGCFSFRGEINWESCRWCDAAAATSLTFSLSLFQCESCQSGSLCVSTCVCVRRNVHFSPRTSWCRGARWEQFLLLIRAATEDQANKANSFSPSAANRMANRGNKCTGEFFKCLCSEAQFIAGVTQPHILLSQTFGFGQRDF